MGLKGKLEGGGKGEGSDPLFKVGTIPEKTAECNTRSAIGDKTVSTSSGQNGVMR